MNKPNQSNKIFADLSLVIVIVGILVPYIISIFSTQELAYGFSIVSILLALIFGIMGRKHKSGIIAIFIAGITLICTATVSLWLTHKEKEALLQMRVIEKEYN